MNPPEPTFSDLLLHWYDAHGRHDLPWKCSRDPYRIWVSEIMLQQTQVATVLPYYRRFMASFPDVHALAGAHPDAVLAHWAGLGYYARARNLQRAAQGIVADYGGVFPADLDTLTTLPGIGRSTAAAILALSHGARHAILDGNVRRVLSRLHRVEGDPGAAATGRRLWALAERHTPKRRVDDYTQAIMDLGATVCTRARPRCGECPVAGLCAAFANGDAADFPHRRVRKARPSRSARFLLIRDRSDRILLQRRPPSGIWGGLWCLPELEQEHHDDPAAWAHAMLGAKLSGLRDYPPIRHKFTHFDLEIRPTGAMVETSAANAIGDDGALRWHTPAEHAVAGMPAPLRKFLDSLDNRPNGARTP